MAQIVQFDPPRLYEGSRVVSELQYDAPSTVSLPAGTPRSMQIKGNAPPYEASSGGAPKVYEIKHTAIVRAGLLTRLFVGQPLAIEAKAIRVWPQKSSVAPFSPRRVHRSFCELKSTVYSAQSQPEANRFELVLIAKPGLVKEFSLGTAGPDEPVTIYSEDKSAVRTRFTLRPTANFSQSEIRATVLASGDGISPAECNDIAARIQATHIR